MGIIMIKLGEPIRVQKNWFMSPQYSLFYNDSVDSEYNEKWQHEYHFVNTRNNLEVKIGGDQYQGVVHYIEWVGFCEGGHPSNQYRVDPYIAIGVFTGDIYSNTIITYQEKLDYQAGLLQEEINQYITSKYDIESLIGSSHDSKKEKLSNDIKWLKNKIEHLNTDKNNLLHHKSLKLNLLQELISKSSETLNTINTQ